MAKKNKKLFDAAGEAARKLESKKTNTGGSGLTQDQINAGIQARRNSILSQPTRHQGTNSTAPAATTGSGRFGALELDKIQRHAGVESTYFEDERKASERIKERSTSAMNRLANAKGPGQEMQVLHEMADERRRLNNANKLRDRSNQGAGKMSTYTNADGSTGYYYQRGKGEQAQLNATFNKNAVPSRVNGMMPQVIDAHNQSKRTNIDKGNYYTQESASTLKYDDGKRTEYFEVHGSGDDTYLVSVPEERYYQRVQLDSGVNPSTVTPLKRVEAAAEHGIKGAVHGLKSTIGSIKANTNEQERARDYAATHKDGNNLNRRRDMLMSSYGAAAATQSGNDVKANEYIKQEAVDDIMNERKQLEEQKKLDEMYQAYKAGASKPMQFAMDVADTTANMAPGMLSNFILPGSFIPEMAVQAYGNSYNQARINGASHDEAVLSGMQNAAVESLSEMMFAGGKTLGKMTGIKGIFRPGKEIEEASLGFIRSTAGKDVVRTVQKLGLAGGEEGAEELVAGIVEPLLDNLIYQHEDINSEWIQSMLHDAAYNALVGFASGGGFGTVDVAQSIRQGADIRAHADVANMINQGLAMPENTKAYSLARSLDNQIKAGQSLGNLDVSDLNNAVREQQAEIQKKYQHEAKTTDETIENNRLLHRSESAQAAYERAMESEEEAEQAITEGASEQEAADRRVGMSAQGAEYGEHLRNARTVLAKHLMPAMTEEASEDPDVVEATRAEAEKQAEDGANTIARVMMGEATVEDFQKFSTTNPALREAYEEIAGVSIPEGNEATVDFMINQNEVHYIAEQRNDKARVLLEYADAVFGDKTGASQAFRKSMGDLSNVDANELEGMIRGFSDAYTIGRASEPNATLPRKPDMMQFLTDDQINAAFEAGKADRRARSEMVRAAEEKIEAAKKSGKRKPKLDHDVASNLNEKERGSEKAKKAIEDMQILQDALNVKITLETARTTADSGNPESSEGWYDKDGIHLNIDADTKVKPLEVVFSHEFTHHLQRYAPKEYQALVEFVIKAKTDNDMQAWERMVEQKIADYGNAGVQLTRDQAIDEIVADMAYEFLNNEQTVERLFAYDATLAEKIKGVMLNMIDKILKFFKTHGSQWKGMEADLNKARQMWLDAAEAAMENADLNIKGETQYLLQAYNQEQAKRIESNPNNLIIRSADDLAEYIKSVHRSKNRGVKEKERKNAFLGILPKKVANNLWKDVPAGPDELLLAFWKPVGSVCILYDNASNLFKNRNKQLIKDELVRISDLLSDYDYASVDIQRYKNISRRVISFSKHFQDGMDLEMVFVIGDDMALHLVNIIDGVGDEKRHKKKPSTPLSDASVDIGGNSPDITSETHGNWTSNNHIPYDTLESQELNDYMSDFLVSGIAGAESMEEYFKAAGALFSKHQAVRIDEENYMLHTMAVFHQTSKMPDWEPSHRSKESGSVYWTNKDGIYRLSDHWGINIGSCDWAIETSDGQKLFGEMDGASSKSKMICGFVPWSEIYYKTQLVNINGKHYLTSPKNVPNKNTIVIDGIQYHRENYKWKATGGKQGQFSLSADSTGRQLTKGQREYFKDSKIRDEQGRLKVMYHGTNNEFTVFDFSQGGKNGTAEGYGIYTADREDVSRHYGGRLIEGYVNITRPAASDQKTIKRSELKKLIKATVDAEAQRLAEDYDGDVAAAAKDTWISNYTYTYDKSLDAAIDEVAGTILDLNDNDMDIVQEVMGGMAIRDYNEAERFYDVLTDVTGIDGFITDWEDSNTGESSQIALAFRSNQIKNVTNENPTADPDIRYSISVGMSDEERYNELKEKTITIARYNPDRMPATVEELKALESQMKKQAFPVLRDLARSLGLIRDDYATPDLDIEFSYSVNSLDESAQKQARVLLPDKYVAMAKMLTCFDEVISNAHLLEVHEDKYKGTRRENTDYIQTDVLISAYQDGETIVPVKLLIKELMGRSNKLHVAIVTDKINGTDLYTQAGNTRNSALSVPNYNLADILKNVNDNQLKKYIPKQFYEELDVKGEVRFSLASDRDREIADLQSKVERLQRDKRRTYGREASNADATRVARALLADTSSDFSLNQTIKAVKELFTMIKRGDDFADIYGYVQGIARSIADSSYDMVEIPGASDLADLRQRFLDARKSQGGSPLKILIPQNLIGDFDRVGGWKEFRAAHKGIVTLSVNSGESYDSFIEGIADEFGEQFNVEGDNSGIDTLISIIEAADSQEARHPVRKAYKDEDVEGVMPDDVDMGIMGGYRDTEVNEIIDRLLDDVADQVAPDLTFADRKAAEKDAAVRKATENERAKWEARRQEWVKNRDKRLAEMREDKKLAVEAARAKGNERLRKQAELYRHQRERARVRRADNESRRKTLDRIYKTTQRLSQKLLKPTDSQHIPEKYRAAVAEMLGWLDFENARTDKWARKHGNVPSERILNLRKLREIYAGIASDKELFDYIEPDDQVYEWMQMLEDLDGSRLATLDAEQLRTVRLVLDAVSWQVNNADKALTEGLKQSRADMATELMDELEAQKGEKLKDGVIKKFLKSDATPVHFFDRLGLNVFKKLYQQLTLAQDTHIKHLAEAQEYIEKNITSKWGNTAKIGNNSLIKKWTEESEKYKLENGKTVEMTGAQVMSLYALNKREQARKHLLGGGIVIAPTKVKRTLKGGVKEYLLNRELQKTRTELTYKDITSILSKMSKEQIDAAEAMLKYLKTTSEWGNETSMKLYGYRKFTEDNYFPIQSAKEFIAGSNLELQRDKKIKNQGMTKNVNEYANNPLVIDDFFEVTTAHINQMSQYNSFVPILEDFDRIYQYREYDPKKQKYHRSVKELIEQKHGRWAADYIETLLKNVNGNYGSEVADIQGFEKLLRNWKAAKIGLSIRVLAQQPTAVVRAFNEIDPKYFVGTPKRGNHKRMWEICPIAEWKHWGYSQTDIHRSMRDTMMGDKHLSDKLFFDMYGKADDLGWGAIFDAVERETKDLMKKGKLKFEYDSAEYRQHVNERFRHIVDRTQVVDSVLHRSQLMRSQNTLTKAMTAFMAEPTISVNTIMTAFAKAQEEARAGHKAAAAKAASRGVGVFVANAVAVSLMASLISAIRESYLPDDDDDDDEKELTKLQQMMVNMGFEEGSFMYDWISGYFIDDFKDNINPLMMLPVTKDMLNMLQGYEAPNPMYQLPQSLIQNAQNMKKWIDEDGDTRYSGRYYIERAAESVAELFGVPAANIRKELIGIQNIYFRAISEKEYGDYLQDRWELNEDYKSNKNIFIDHYLNAKKAGHDESAKDIREQLLKSKVRDDEGNLVFTDEAIQKRAWSVYAPNFKDDVIAGRDVSKQEKDLKSVGITAEDIDDKKSKALVSSISDAVEMGDTNRLEDLYGVLEKYGYGEYDVDKKVKSAASDLMYDAIDAENYDEADRYINVITDVTGYTRDDVVSSITTHYMSSYYEAMDAGDQSGVNRVTSILGKYGVSSNTIREKEAEHYKDYYRQKAYMAYSSGNTAEAYRIATEYNQKYPGVYSKGVDGMIYGIQNLSDETIRRYNTSGKYAEWQLP